MSNTKTILPEVVRLSDGRPGKPENAAGIGEFWYEPEIWNLPLSPAARVLYTTLCSFLWNQEINRKDLSNALKDSSETETLAAIDELVSHRLLTPSSRRGGIPGYEVKSVKEFE